MGEYKDVNLDDLGIDNGVDNIDVTDDGMQPDDSGQPGGKTLTQTEVDEIVKDRLARERKKYADYDDVKADKETLTEISSILAKAGVSGTPTEQAKYLKDFYGIDAGAADGAPKEPDSETKAFVAAERFSRRANDDDVVDEVERILAIPAHKRKAGDNVKLEVLEGRYGSIKFRQDYSDAEKWYKETGGSNFTELLQNSDFKEFADGINAPLKSTVQKFLKFSGGVKEPKSPGSAKDIGGTAIKEYYSPSDVDKLTDAQLSNPKIWQKVRESMTKWK